MSKEIKVTTTWDSADFNELIRKLNVVHDKLKEISGVKIAGSLLDVGGGQPGQAPVGSQSSSQGGGTGVLEKLVETYGKVGEAGEKALGVTTEALSKHLGKMTTQVTQFIALMKTMKGSFSNLPSGLQGALGAPLNARSPALIRGLPMGGSPAQGQGVIGGGGGPAGAGGAGGGGAGGAGGGGAGGGGAGGNAGIMAAFRSLGGSFIGSMAGNLVGGGVGQTLGSAIGGMPFISRLMPAIGIGVAAGHVALGAVQAGYADEGAQLKYRTVVPFLGQARRAEVLEAYGSRAMSIREGNMALVSSIQRADASPEGKAITQFVADKLEQVRRDYPVTAVEGLVTGGLGGVGQVVKAKAGHTINEGTTLSGMGGELVGSGYAARAKLVKDRDEKRRSTGMDALQSARKLAENEVMNEATRRRDENIQAQQRMTPIENARINTLYQGALADFDVARQSGRRGEIGYKLGPALQPGVSGPRTARYFDDVVDHEVAALMTFHDPSAVRAQMGRSLHASGRRGSEPGAGALLDAQAAGLANATELRAIGYQMGAKGFYGAYQGMLGTNRKGGGLTGLGGVAGSHLGSAIMGHMNAGNFRTGSGGVGFAQVLADASRSGDPSQDIRNVMQVRAGLGRFSRMAAGQTDGLQKAINWNAAVVAAPEGAFKAREALAEMDTPTMMGLLTDDGPLPTGLTARGVTKPMLRAALNARNAGDSSRITGKRLEGTPILEAVQRRYVEAGNSFSYLAGYSDKDYETEVAHAAEILAGGNVSLFDAQGVVRTKAAFDSGRQSKGRGVSQGVDKKGPRATALYERIKIRKRKGEELGYSGEVLANYMRQGLTVADHEQDAGGMIAEMMVGTGAPAEAAKEVARVMIRFAKTMEDLAEKKDGKTLPA